jgi:hypothetical protein
LGIVPTVGAAARTSGAGSGTSPVTQRSISGNGELDMNGIIYLVGLVVVIIAVLSFFGLR